MAELFHYAELWCLSNFSFLRGASHPAELVMRAKKLGYSALALTDECSLAGIVRAHVAAKEHGLPLLVGSQFQVDCDSPFTLIVIATSRNGYGNLCEFITRLRRSATKGNYHLSVDAIDPDMLSDCVVLIAPDRNATPAQLEVLARWSLQQFMGRCWLAVQLLRELSDEMWLYRMRQISDLTAIPLVAAGDVHMHIRSRKPLQDVMTATRAGLPLTECGFALHANAERHLRTRLRLVQIYPPDLLSETLKVVARCHFSLSELRYEYPKEVVPTSEGSTAYLRRVTLEGARRRWPEGVPENIGTQIDHELRLIAELRYEHYFLSVYDIVAFARARHILCQGRGSAANSVVCYCLGITEVDPARMSVLFERFISKERNEPPDIDVDFEHERREEVMQYLYQKYGRDRAALTGSIISYQPKSAVRDVGKALGLPPQCLEVITQGHHGWDQKNACISAERLIEAGLNPEDLAVQQLQALTRSLLNAPRHLSQHTGGFVLTQGKLSRTVPIENASMADRTVMQWDKDDLDAMGLLKVDILALGMLTALRKALHFISQRKGRPFALQDIPAEDAPTYDMVCQADTVGVFQIESRAQMSMLPRLRPRCFYDLVIEVALVRPGPIQGGMVHPYLQRRQGKEPVHYPSAELEQALGRTLGVPVFQEQVMQIAMLAAGFSAGEADGLRRAMAAWKRKGGIEKYYQKIVDGMTQRGYPHAFAESIFQQIQGFSEYGFPESHAASFALLVYASSWIKRHHPAEFLAALLNSQPMGFYTPSQLIQDARRHHVVVHPVDVLHSDIDCKLEALTHNPNAHPAVRLGLKMVMGLQASAAQRIVQTRSHAPFSSAQDLAHRASLQAHDMKVLAAADALASLAGHRRQQIWEAAAQRPLADLLENAPIMEDALTLAPAPAQEEVAWDYAALGLTLRAHPLSFIRPRLNAHHLMPALQLRNMPDGTLLRCCGIVTLRQQPPTAKGTLFVTLEDETGMVQVICWASIPEAERKTALNARLLAVYGRWQRQGEVCNLIAQKFKDLTPWIGAIGAAGSMGTRSRDFH